MEVNSSLTPTFNSSTWITKNFSSDAVNWYKDANNYIYQDKISTSKSNITGSALIFPETKGLPNFITLLNFRPATTYQSGLVFDYIDESNFCVLIINQFSESYSGFKVCIYCVTAGNIKTIHEEKLNTTITSDLSLIIKSEPEGLSFNLDNTEIYLWNDAFVQPNSLIGLYTQQCDNAVFKNIYMGSQSDVEEVFTEEGLENLDKPDGIVSTSEDEIGLREEISAGTFDSYLKLQSPKSQGQVEFKEVFNVPLDSFYLSLFQSFQEVPEIVPDPYRRLVTANQILKKLDIISAIIPSAEYINIVGATTKPSTTKGGKPSIEKSYTVVLDRKTLNYVKYFEHQTSDGIATNSLAISSDSTLEARGYFACAHLNVQNNLVEVGGPVPVEIGKAHFATSKNGETQVFYSRSSRNISVVDNSKVSRSLVLNDDAHFIFFIKQDSILVIYNFEENKLYFYDLKSLELMTSIYLGIEQKIGLPIAINNDNTLIAVGSKSDLKLYSVDTGLPLKTLSNNLNTQESNLIIHKNKILCIERVDKQNTNIFIYSFLDGSLITEYSVVLYVVDAFFVSEEHIVFGTIDSYYYQNISDLSSVALEGLSGVTDLRTGVNSFDVAQSKDEFFITQKDSISFYKVSDGSLVRTLSSPEARDFSFYNSTDDYLMQDYGRENFKNQKLIKADGAALNLPPSYSVLEVKLASMNCRYLLFDKNSEFAVWDQETSSFIVKKVIYTNSALFLSNSGVLTSVDYYHEIKNNKHNLNLHIPFKGGDTSLQFSGVLFSLARDSKFLSFGSYNPTGYGRPSIVNLSTSVFLKDDNDPQYSEHFSSFYYDYVYHSKNGFIFCVDKNANKVIRVFTKQGEKYTYLNPFKGIVDEFRISSLIVDEKLKYLICRTTTDDKRTQKVFVINIEDDSIKHEIIIGSLAPPFHLRTLPSELEVVNKSLSCLDLHTESNVWLFKTAPHSLALYSVETGEKQQDITTDSYIHNAWFNEEGDVVIFHPGDIRVYKTDVTIAKDLVSLDESYKFNIDTRPKEWYRDYKVSDDEEQHQRKTSDNLKQLIDSLNTGPSGSHDELRSNLLRMSSYRRLYEESIVSLFKARDAKNSIIHDLRVSGYNLLDSQREDSDGPLGPLGYIKNGNWLEYNVGVGEALTAKGYDFAIISGVPDFKEYQPLKLDISTYDLSDVDDWLIIKNKFKSELFASSALTPEQEQLFVSQAAELETFSSSDLLLNREKVLLANIEDSEEKLVQIEGGKTDIATDKLMWERDFDRITKIKDQMSKIAPSYKDLGIVYDRLNNIKKSFEKIRFRFNHTVSESFWTRKHTFNFLFFSRTTYQRLPIYYKTYKIEHQHKEDSSSVFGAQYKRIPNKGYFRYLSVFGPSPSIQNYLRGLQALCDEFQENNDGLNAQAELDKIKVQNEILFHNKSIQNLKDSGLKELRTLFLRHWNSPDQFGARKILDHVIRPDSDPLADLLVSFLPDNSALKDIDDTTLDSFEFVGDRYYSQNGLTLPAYLQYVNQSKSNRVAIFPKLQDDGNIDSSLSTAIVNPRQSDKLDFQLPKIKFVETHKIIINWSGYSMGELSHTENLFPSETKEITIERTTELVRKREESRTDSSIETSKQTSSFEDNLTKEFSIKDKNESAKEDSYELSQKKSLSNTFNTHQSDVEDFKVNADVSYGAGPFKAKIDAHYNKNRTKTSDSSKKDTFELSNTKKGKTSSKESRETFAKQVANTIKKVANETTKENKVEIKVSSSESFTNTSSQKEIVRIENPNVGRTINYNFFQLQNTFEVKTILTDVKIVLDMNEEVIKGTGVSDVRVFELEEIGKIFSSFDNEDPKTIITAAITARQVFKNYLSTISGVGRGNGALAIKEPFFVNNDVFNTLFFSNELIDEELGEPMLRKLSVALEYLKKVPFIFNEIELNKPETYTVNTGSYFLDSEVGKMTALEDYLEHKRSVEIELDKKTLEGSAPQQLIN